MPLNRSIVIEDDFNVTERRQAEASDHLAKSGPSARFLAPQECSEIWRHIRGKPELQTFAQSGFERFNHNHGALPDRRALFVFRGSPVDQHPSLGFMSWGSSDFGYTLRALVKLNQGLRQVALLVNDAAFEALWGGRCILAFLRLGRLEQAFELDYAADPAHSEALSYLLALTEGSNRAIRASKTAYLDREFALASSVSTIFKREWIRSDWLQHGRITAYEEILPAFISRYIEASAAAARIMYRSPLVRFPVIGRALQIISGTEINPIQAIFHWMSQDGNAYRFLGECLALEQDPVTTEEKVEGATTTLIQYLILVMKGIDLFPWTSDLGRRQTYIDREEDGAIKSIMLAPESFPVVSDEEAQEYWHKRFATPFDAHHYLSPTDLPANPTKLLALWDLDAIDIDTAAATETRGYLIDEATALKKWMIPMRAMVEIPVGPFVGVEVTEVFNEVHFAWRTREGRFWLTMVCPQERHFVVPPISDGPDKKADEKIEATLSLLMAALLRDFWVVDERQRIFDVVIRRDPTGRTEKPQKRVVYLPRIRYDLRTRPHAGFMRVSRELDQVARSRHFVRAFFRKVDKPSPLQLALARFERVVVPPGRTYVRAHYRGGGESQVVYRSRSAMQLIFESIERPSVDRLPIAQDWFEFERMVSILMEKHLGFTVLRRAVRGRGDAGVDIVAVKTTQRTNELWLVQCKHYGADNPVGPSTIRELLGSMEDMTPDEGQIVRGMIVTTSRFTPDAVKLAVKHGIQATGGEDLVAICSAINREIRTNASPLQ
jgi:hypothetical protein